MKKVILGASISVAIMSFVAFKVAAYEAKKNTAEVEQYQGVYIFTDSKPIQDYEFLGTTKGGLGSIGGQYTGIRDNLIKRAKKDYPSADGLIFHFNSGGADRCDAIKFK